MKCKIVITIRYQSRENYLLRKLLFPFLYMFYGMASYGNLLRTNTTALLLKSDNHRLRLQQKSIHYLLIKLNNTADIKNNSLEFSMKLIIISYKNFNYFINKFMLCYWK